MRRRNSHFIIAGRSIHEGRPSRSTAVSALMGRPAFVKSVESGSIICMNSRARMNRQSSHHHFGKPFWRSSLGAEKISPCALGSTISTHLRWRQMEATGHLGRIAAEYAPTPTPVGFTPRTDEDAWLATAPIDEVAKYLQAKYPKG